MYCHINRSSLISISFCNYSFLFLRISTVTQCDALLLILFNSVSCAYTYMYNVVEKNFYAGQYTALINV